MQFPPGSPALPAIPLPAPGNVVASPASPHANPDDETPRAKVDERINALRRLETAVAGVTDPGFDVQLGLTEAGHSDPRPHVGPASRRTEEERPRETKPALQNGQILGTRTRVMARMIKLSGAPTMRKSLKR